MFFGWRVVAGSFAAMMIVVGFYTYAFTLLVPPLQAEFGATLEEVMYSMTLSMIAGLFLGPISGALIDRYNVRCLMTGGLLALSAGFWILGQAESILAFNIAFGAAFAVANALAGAVAANAAVSRWFALSRGRALGIATIGTSVGGMLLPLLVGYWLAQEYGWRGAMNNLSLLTLLLITPFVWWNVRGRPAELGLLPDGAAALPASPEKPAASPPPATAAMTMWAIVRQRSFWLIGLSVALLVAAFSPMLANLSPYAKQQGFAGFWVTILPTALASAGIIGKLAFGFAADKLNLKWGMWAAHGLVIAAFVILSLEPAYPAILAASILMGFSTGGFLPVWNAMLARIYGVDSFGRAMGAMGPLITLIVAPSFIIVGRLFDHYNSYVPILHAQIAILLTAAALLLPLSLNPAAPRRD